MLTHAESNGMKVLHIVGDSRYGGVVRIILGLGQIAKADGWQVDVLATDPKVGEALRRESIGVVDLDVIRREIRPFRDLAGLVRLCNFLRSQNYGIVHTHTSKGGFVGRLAAWLAGVPVIVHTMHGFAIHEASPAWARVIYTALERLASRWCHCIVSVSEFHRRWALELSICPETQILAIPNGITSPWRNHHFDPARLRRQLGIGEDDLLVLTPTRLALDKGVQYLIEAAALLPRGERRYRLVIAGDGPARPYLERLARDRGVCDTVTFLGFREDVGALLAAADLVALPSLREGLSISMLEAMSAAKPIIASSIGSHREVAAKAEMAMLVPPADPAALAGAIQRVGQDPELMDVLAARALSLFEACYTEERMLEGYRQLYLSLLAANSQAAADAPAGRSASVIRNATAADLDGIVDIHQKAFNQFFLTRMGAAFLRRYYELVLNYHAGIVLVSERHGTLTGFVCGFGDPAEFYRSMWRNRLAFALPAAGALLRHPSLCANMVNAVRRIQTTATKGPPLSCELSSIAVAPEAAGRGLGKALLRAFLEHSWARRAECVYLTTDAEGNEAANELYREIGFEHSRRFLQQKGRWMNEYVFHRVSGSQPVETAL
jgi:glycosyltransferase involved in cell wall biosynthesis/ribosomal protein S18 acetylase RimI-like enzyme